MDEYLAIYRRFQDRVAIDEIELLISKLNQIWSRLTTEEKIQTNEKILDTVRERECQLE